MKQNNAKFSESNSIGRFQMTNVSEKRETHRFARSEGRITLSKESFAILAENDNPKGDVLAMAEVAGLMALKKTSDILPLCHPLAIQSAQIRFFLEPESFSVRVESAVHVIGRTGAEMESLMGLQGALLCVYDFCKAVDPLIDISDVRLLEKKGGKSGHWINPKHAQPDLGQKKQKGKIAWSDMRIGVVTLSDRASQGTYQDASGPLVCSFLTSWGAQMPSAFLLPDDPEKLSNLLRTLASESYDLVICTGGTGFAPRDTTPETLSRVCDRMIPGFGELLRHAGSLHTPLSYLSRSVAGLLQKTIILCIPGSPNAVQESMPALKDVLPTGIMVARGQNPHEESKPVI